jgi:type I restriction enzyme, S subunit
MTPAPLVQHFDLIAQASGGVARLRELILTLAVQGKLVPQDPSDESASELLKKIRAEKDRLIAEGKIKRDKPLAEIADEEMPFELPSTWSWCKGREIFNVIRGVTYQKTDARETFTEDHLPLLRANNIQATINLDDLVYVPRQLVSDDQRLRKGDYLVCLASGSKKLVGKAAPFTSDLACSFGAFCGVIRPVSELDFLSIYLSSPLYRDTVSAASAGIGINNLKGTSLLGLDIPLPPMAEQSRIVTRVEELMQVCDALEASDQLEAQQHAQLVNTLLCTLTQSETPEALADNWQRIATHFDVLLDRPEAVDALEQTILQLAVRGLLVPQDPTDEPASVLLQKIRTEKDQLIAQGKIKRDKSLPPITEEEKPFELPQGWQWVRFDELTHPLKPIAYGVLVPGPDVETGIPFVRIADLSLDSPASKPEKSISPEIDAQFQRTRLEGGEILMGVVGSIGKLGVAPKTWAGANIARAICRIVPADSGLKEFVLFLLQTKFMQESFAGDTRTLAQPTLNVGLIRAALTPLPPPEEQSRIVIRVNELRSLCADLRQRLSFAQGSQSQLAQVLVEQQSIVTF